MARGSACPIQDALTANRAVIAPDWGGSTDLLYYKPGRSLGSGCGSSRAAPTPVVQDYPLFDGGQLWADPDILAAQEAIRTRSPAASAGGVYPLYAGVGAARGRSKRVGGAAQVDIGDLTTSLDVKVGGVLEEPELQVLLIDAVGTFNAYAPQQVGLEGTTFDRELVVARRATCS